MSLTMNSSYLVIWKSVHMSQPSPPNRRQG
uniref:Uncharacterized protein n=1 Tax=Anguilla anguilla TaxID=7936 RepID=A0A0E9R7M4_ANGAN